MTARENLDFFLSLYKKRVRTARDLLALVGLEAEADKRVSAYSKGMKSRLNFVKAIAHEPELLFLDEPTSGLDPSNARIVKDLIRAEQRRGAAVILTTHNMHDAAELCDRVAFIVDGEIRALDTPRNLVMKRGASMIEYSYLDGGEEVSREVRKSVPLSKSGDDQTLVSLIREGRLTSIHSSEPTLEDIFVDITGGVSHEASPESFILGPSLPVSLRVLLTLFFCERPLHYCDTPRPHRHKDERTRACCILRSGGPRAFFYGCDTPF